MPWRRLEGVELAWVRLSASLHMRRMMTLASYRLWLAERLV